jgi:hypothetical protein
MNTIQQLKHYVRDIIVKHPEKRSEVLDLLELCMNEIEEGGSPIHEISLCINDINQLIENQEA